MDENPNITNNLDPDRVLLHHRSFGHWLVVALAIFSVVGYIVVSFYLNLWPFEIPVPIPIFTPRPSSAVNVEDISNWKTYSNEEYGFEFKYPGEGILRELNNKNSWDLDKDVILINLKIISLNISMQMSKNNYVKVGEDWDQSFKTKIGEVMWRPFYAGINQVGDVQSPNLVGFQAKNNGFFYSISYDETQGYELNLLQNKILSTFRFIDPSTTSELDTSSWKIHRNEKFGIEFKYPELTNVQVGDFDNGGGYIKLPSGVDLVYKEGPVPDLVGTNKETVIKIDGKDYPMFNQPYPGFSQSRIIISPTKEIIINITNTDGENHDEIDLIYQILSTFKLI